MRQNIALFAIVVLCAILLGKQFGNGYTNALDESNREIQRLIDERTRQLKAKNDVEAAAEARRSAEIVKQVEEVSRKILQQYQRTTSASRSPDAAVTPSAKNFPGSKSKLGSFRFENVALGAPLVEFISRFPSASLTYAHRDSNPSVSCYTVNTQNGRSVEFAFRADKLGSIEIGYSSAETKRLGADGFAKLLADDLGAPTRTTEVPGMGIVLTWELLEPRRCAEFALFAEGARLHVHDTWLQPSISMLETPVARKESAQNLVTMFRNAEQWDETILRTAAPLIHTTTPAQRAALDTIAQTDVWNPKLRAIAQRIADGDTSVQVNDQTVLMRVVMRWQSEVREKSIDAACGISIP